MKNKKVLWLSFLFYSCASAVDEGFERLYLREINKPPVKLEWFYYSFITSTSPDSILLHHGQRTETVCFSDNVADVKLSGDTIVIGFYGRPTRYTQPIELPKRVLNHIVVADTTYTDNPNKPRKTYKK